MRDDQDTVDLGQRTIPMSRLEFAIKRCEEFIACANHQNIDEDFVTELSEEEWNLFLEDYTAAVHSGGGIENTSEKSDEQLQVCISAPIRFPFISFFHFYNILYSKLQS